MWPALALALLLAAVWHWGTAPESALAQSQVSLEVSTSSLEIEEGSSASYRVRLSNAPLVPLFVAPVASDSTVVSVGPSLLEFTPSNWSTYQTVYLAAKEDDAVGVPAPGSGTVSHESSDSSLDVSGSFVSFTVTDDDTPGVILSKSALMVDEGDAVSYLVSLRSSSVSGDVDLSLSSADEDIITVRPASLTFTAANWNLPQTVLVSGVRDDVADGAVRSVAVRHVPAGGDYDGLTVPDVSASVRDDDVKGFVFSADRLAVQEGGISTYDVRLSSKPTSDVAVAVTSSDVAKATVSKAALTFTPSDWKVPQTVVVSGVDDGVATGIRSVTISHRGSGGGYDTQRGTVAVGLANDDSFPNSRVVVHPAFLAVDEGTSDSYELRLSSSPTGDVVVELRSGDRGVATVSPSSLTFTPDNWEVFRTVEVTGAEDRSRVLGDRVTQVTHSVSGRVEYYVSVVVHDDDADSSDFGVEILSMPADGLTVAEGSTATYTVRLSRRPTGDVRFFISSSDASTVSVDPPSLTFTPLDWSVPQTVTVRSVDDWVASGDAVRAMLLHRASGGGYDLMSVDALDVKVIDDDQRGVSITPTLLTLAEGASGSYSVVLESEPSSDVSFRVVGVAGQTAADGSDLDDSVTGDAGGFTAWISRSSLLTFTSADWRVPQTVHVHTGNDGDPNGTRAVVFGHDVSGGGYGGHDVDSVTLLLLDDDRSGLTISDAAVSLGVGEEVSYRVWLNAPLSPGASKTIDLESSIASVAAVSPPSLTFDADNWNVPSSVVVTGVAGGRATVSHKDGDEALLGSVFVTVRSGVGAGVTVRPASLSVGVGGNGSYSVVLDERPAASVTVTARSDVPTVAAVFPDSLVFAPDNWSEPQYFSVDGIRVGSAVISHVADGAGFSGTPVGDLSVSVSPDTPVVQVSTAALSIGVGGKGVYWLTLESGSDATVTVTSSDTSRAVVSHSSVGLTSVAPTQSVQVTGVGAGTVVISHSVTGGGSAPVVNVAVADNAVLEGFDLGEDRGDAGSRWAYVGDVFDIRISGSSGLEDGKVWVYQVLVGDDSAAPLSCDPDGVSVLQIAEADYSSSDLTIEDVQTSLSFFELGANYLCVVDADGNGTSSRPLKFTLHEPPDTYRVWLKDAAIGRGGLALTDGSLPNGFRVLQGRQAVDGHPWKMPQYRGVGAAEGDVLTETSGALFHCEEVTVADQQVGCEWEESARLSAEPWRVGYEVAGSEDDVVQVPGDELSFRVDLEALLGGRGESRIGVFWGPVDLWRLDADAETADFAIHEEHTLGLAPGESVHFIEQSHLTDDGFYEFTIPRHGSSNMDGRTFVALVRCNDDLIRGDGSGSPEVQRNRSAFSDCSVLPANAVNFEIEYEDPADDAEIVPLRLAWAQHNVISGRGMTCEKVDVIITRTSELVDPNDDSKGYNHSYVREYGIDCHNDVAGISSFTQTAVDKCDADLREAATYVLPANPTFVGATDDGKAGGVFTNQYATADSPLYCGFGPPTPFVGDSAYPWGSARYNAARSFYGFVIDWQKGFGGGPSYGGCIMLLPHSTVRHDNGTHSFYGEGEAGQPLPYGTKRWLVGDAGEFSVPEGSDTTDLCFLAPEEHPDWDVGAKDWYNGQRMHFAVYMSGMPVEHDVRVNAVPDNGWRRVSLGSWDWGEADGVPGNGTRRRVGRALPTVSASDLSPPAIHAFQPRSGYAYSVSRDYADAHGRVHLYIVPCLPWGSSTEDPCADLAEGTGSGTAVRFQQRQADAIGPAASSGGPFGVDWDEDNPGDLIIWYSQKATVSLGNVALGKLDDRPVSFPRLTDMPKESGCVVRRDRGFWPERLVQGGGCTLNSANPVDVVVKNSRDTDELQNFVVYATGGRSDGLDLVNMRRFSGFGSSPVRLARLGLLERVVTVPSGAVGEAKVVVTPDMAGGDGDVYLLFYECGGGDKPLCARNSRGSSGDVPHYDMRGDPAFVVRVDYTAAVGLVESGLGPVCQGLNCIPLVPFLRAEVPSDGCKVQGYSGGVDDLTYLADRVISGGACNSGIFEPMTVTVENPTTGARRLVVYSTGGRGHSLDLAQVRRPRSGYPIGYPVGKSGLQRDFLDLEAGATGSVTVDYSMTPDHLPDLGSEDYRGWPQRSVHLLAYACDAGVCPDAVDPTLPTVFSVDQRPLFQVIASWELPRKVLVAPDSLSIAEGESGTYTVVLGSQPTGEVFVTPTASPSGSVTFAPAPLVFGPLNWRKPQTVTATSEHDDDVADDSIQITHLVSGADYGDAGLCPAGCPVSVTVTDDDMGGAVVSERELSVREDSSVEYSVTLGARPSGPVTIAPSVSPVSGVATVSPVSLTFTPVNWDLPQMVTVSGVGDAASHDPLRTATISHSASGVGYDSVSIPSVVVTVLDVDLPGISPSVRLSDYTLTMAAGASESYTLVLGARPSGDVTITLSNSDVGTATASPASLTFTADNWSDPQTVTVDGFQAGKAVISHNVAGGGYDSVRIRSVVATVTPGASVKGVAFSATSMSIVVDNVGAYTAVLTAPPAGDVTLTATSGATGVATVSPASWTFSAGNWDQPRTFRVSAVALGSATITHTASGGDYGTVSVPDMGITVVESGTPGGGLGGVHPSASVVGGADSQPDWRWGPDPLPSVWQRSPAASAFDVSWTTPVRPGWLFQPEPLSHAVAGFPAALPATVFGWPVGAGDVSASEHLRDRGWQWLGDYFNFALSGFSPNQRVWAYRLVVDAGASPPADCRTDGRSSLPIAPAELGPDGNHIFANLLVSADLFEVGENYVCAADSKGLMLPQPKVLTVYDPPDVYRMQLTIHEVERGTSSSLLAEDFQVIDGQHYQGASDSPWAMPQYRGQSRDDYLTRTQGDWRRCFDGPAGKVGRTGDGFELRQVGCDWDDHDAAVPGEIGMVAVAGEEDSVQVPGDDVEFRIGFHPTQFSGREQERFAIFWGPVDLWLLGAPGESSSEGVARGPVSASDYVIHESHLDGLNSALVTQLDLDADGYYTLSMNRDSSNARGDMFVAVVPCNEDYLGAATPGTDLWRYKLALPDCSRPLVPEVNFDVKHADEDEDAKLEVLRLAWQQHDVTSGLGMSCDVTVEVTRVAIPRSDVPLGVEPGHPDAYTYERAYNVRCENDLPAVTVEQSSACDGALRDAAVVRPTTGWDDDQAVETYPDLSCGWGPPKPFLPDADYWATTKYNAARSIYGFVVDWYRGGGNRGGDRPGCSIDLLRYRETADGGRVSVLEGQQPVGTRYWRLGTAPENDVECLADSGDNELDVEFFTAKADPDWSDVDQRWHGDQAAHLALYVSGLTSEHDYRAGDDVGGGADDGWRRVALGAWDWRDGRIGLDGGLHRPLGMALPQGGSDVSLPGDAGGTASGLSLAKVSEFYDGNSFTVSRDFADRNGVVRLYVVPCLPNYAYSRPELRVCRDLAAGAGHGYPLEFRQGASDAGPFGLETTGSGQVLHYSYVITVTFDEMTGGDRPVSIPSRELPSSGTACEVVRHRSGHWVEALVSGGACDRDDLSPVNVSFRNEGSDDARLAVYVTGGRSHGLDLVEVMRASRDADGPVRLGRLGRLGLLERADLSMPPGGVDSLMVSPDMANAKGEVWLLVYRCEGSLAVAICPRSARGAAGEISGYDMGPAVSTVVLVRFTAEAKLVHTSFGPICQGSNCAPPAPEVLREALPDLGGDVCGVRSYDGGRLWPDRLVRGGVCAQEGTAPVAVKVEQPGSVRKDLVVFATGGRTPGWESIQVNRGDGSEGGVPAGAVGLRQVQMSASGQVLVDPDLADDQGRVLLLAYLCSDSSDATQPTDPANCPSGRGDSLTTFDVSRRPLFQVLVEYDSMEVSFQDIAICKGDTCTTNYGLGRVALPDGDSCGVVASLVDGTLYWPDRVVAGGACDRDDLSDVTVSLGVPSGSAGEKLVVYVTGGRTDGLDKVQVRLADQQSSRQAYLDRYIPFPEVTVSDHAAARVRSAAVEGILAEKPWMDGNLNAVEQRVYDAVVSLASFHSSGQRVARMPFLDSIDELDYLTVEVLIQARLHSVADVIVDHAEFADGITDDDRVLVIGAFAYHEGGADAVRERISRGRYDFESSRFFTPSTRDLVITVAVDRDASVDRSSLERLTRDSVAKMEEMMGDPFPLRHVLLFVDAGMFADDPGVAGYNYGMLFMAVGPGSEQLRATVIHEVAHYYWIGAEGALWLTEGMAEMAVAEFGPGLEIGYDGVRPPGSCKAENLSELRRGGYHPGCPYYLGQQLFIKLKEAVGDETFRAGIRRLYDVLEDKRNQGGEPWIDHLRTAFKDSPRAQLVINQAWNGTAHPPVVPEARDILGRLGVRQVDVVSTAGNSAAVLVNPDLADSNGDVWVLAYQCDAEHGDDGCPKVLLPASNGYDLPVGPAFAVRVRFTPESSLKGADLKEVCRGKQCDIVHPWLRRAEPDIGECGARLGTYWPDRVIRGGDCYVRGSNYGPVVFKSDAAEKFVVYTTGDGRRELDLVQVHGVFGDVGDDAANDSGKPLGKHGLRESLIELAAGGEERAWVRADMADDDGNVWLFAYRCEADHGDAGCPLVDRDQVRPSYDVPVRPTFVVRVSFVSGADADRSTLEAHCATGSRTCELTATFRDADGTTLPGTVEFRVDRGALGEAGSTAQVSRKRHVKDATGNYQFKETLILPADGGMVNVEAELLGDGTVLPRRVGHARNVARLSAEVMRCSGDEKSCHAGGLIRAERLLAGDHFVLAVTGYDASGDVALPVTRLGEAECRAGRAGAWPTFQLNSEYLRSYGYGTSQPTDLGYAGCAIQVSENASVGRHGITVSYRGGAGAPVTTRVQVVVGVDTSKLGYLVLSGPSQIESGESDTYRVVGLNLERLRMGYDLDGGCLKLNLSGALEGGEGGSASSGCISDGLPKSGVEFTVQAKEDVLYQTDSSVGVSYGDIKVSNHVMVTPAEDDAGAPVPATSSHISNLTISQEGGQLSVTWNGSPQADFKSLRAQVWVVVGGEDVFLPGCQGGEVHAVDTQQVFCLLSYGQSEDVYHAAVGFIRYDDSAVPVETTRWTRP